MAPKATVIIAVYNCEAYIGECVKSLLNQTFSNFEVIVVDDGSRDASLNVAQTESQGDKRFSFVKLSKNGGLGHARNVGLDKAQGDYIVFLDADDYFSADAIEKIVGRMDEQQLDDLYFSAETMYDSAEAKRMLQEDLDNRDSFDGVATGPELFSFFEKRNQWMPHGALRAVRRSLLERFHIRFSETIIHEDLLFTFQSLVQSTRSSFLNVPVYKRRIRSGSIMAQPKKTLANIRGHYVCVSEIESWTSIHAHQLSDEFLAAVAHRIAEYRCRIGGWWIEDISDTDKEAFLQELEPAARFEFLSEWEYPAQFVIDKQQEYLDSITWRVGNVFTSGPRAVRRALGK